MKPYQLLVCVLLITCTQPKKSSSLFSQLQNIDSQIGNDEYLSSSFVAAGDRAYVVGHQDGSFPPLGWHVKDEMGGVWIHPIKILDGYGLTIKKGAAKWELNNASKFTNYPVGNMHTFENAEMGLEVNRMQFVPDGLMGVVVSYEINNTGEQSLDVQLKISADFDLMPVWLADQKGIENGKDSLVWEASSASWMAMDSKNTWFAISTIDDKDVESSQSLNTGTIIKNVSIGKGQSYTFNHLISGSYSSENEAMEVINNLKNADQLFSHKMIRYQKLKEATNLESPDAEINEMFTWIKYNTDWLVREVPELGRGLSAGIPDYPWWFGTDNGYILQGLVSAGMHKEALSTIELIVKLSENRNGESGQIMHEASTNGVVFNPGNLNTTPTFIIALWDVYRWTADSTIVDNYYDNVIAGIRWTENQDHDGNGYPDGPGMMEIPGLHTEMIDVVAYQASAYQAAANFANIRGDEELVSEFNEKAEFLTQRINSDWWVNEFNSYADFRATKEETLALIDAAIVRADTIEKPWSVEELHETRRRVTASKNDDTQGYVVHHNWVVNTPMEMGLADPDKAKKALETARKYENRFGLFVTGIDRDESQVKAEKWKSFSYVGAVMTLPTGVQAIGAANYGQIHLTLEYLKKLHNSFGYALPGSMYEVSPDFGMMAQGWNVYAVAVPMVNHLFGVRPEAHNKKIYIEPQIPEIWNEGQLSNIVVGNNSLNISFTREQNTLQFTIDQTKGWELIFINQSSSIIKVNQKNIAPDEKIKL